MQEAKKIVINIVASDALAYLPNFFASLESQDANEFSVTIVDNASQDGTVKWIQDQYTDVAVLRNFRDQGFARAANQAIELALSRWPDEDWGSHFILMVDPAIELGVDCLFNLTHVLLQDPELSAACPKILQTKVKSVAEDGRREIERTDILFSTGLSIDKFRRAVNRGEGEVDRGQYNAPSEVFGAPIMCGLFRASHLMKTKIRNEFIDEDFVDFNVDADLAWRMKRLGLRSMYVPLALAYKQNKPREGRGKNKTRNRFWMMVKNDEPGNMILHAPWISASLMIYLITALVSLNKIRAMARAVYGVPGFFAKRKFFVRQIRIKGSAMRRWFV
ncbi:MAG: glycosyltransferase [Patescibacteria group bacterium]